MKKLDSEYKFYIIILIVILSFITYWHFCIPEPKIYYREITELERREDKKAIKKYGDYLIECNKETGEEVMLKGNERIKL